MGLDRQISAARCSRACQYFQGCFLPLFTKVPHASASVSYAVHRDSREKEGWGPKGLWICSICMETQVPWAHVLCGSQSLAFFPPQSSVDSVLYLVNKLFLYKRWVWIFSEKEGNQSQAYEPPISTAATMQKVNFSGRGIAAAEFNIAVKSQTCSSVPARFFSAHLRNFDLFPSSLSVHTRYQLIP